jgi:Ser/Thr protein kinase RdoA (MazF antagonist)
MSTEEVARGPALRGVVSPALFTALRDHYGLRSRAVRDLGGSANLNLLLTEDRLRYVVRVYRPWVTAARLADLQQVRRHLAGGGVPCALPLATRSGDSWIRVADRRVEVEHYGEHVA